MLGHVLARTRVREGLRYSVWRQKRLLAGNVNAPTGGHEPTPSRFVVVDVSPISTVAVGYMGCGLICFAGIIKGKIMPEKISDIGLDKSRFGRAG